MGNSVSGVASSGKSCANNSTLFHLLSDRLWEEAIRRANTHPLETIYQYQDGGNMTPLHLACHMNAPASVISALIRANPSSISYCTVGGYTPLHVAIWRRASVEVIREFVRSAPSALWKQNKSDCTPLHLACWNFYSEDVIDVLLQADPRTAMLQTVELDTPLHYAAMQNNVHVPDEVISLFIRHIPDALTAVNDQGDTALHICCRKGISFDLLQEFVLVCSSSTWNNDEGANNGDSDHDHEQEKALNVNVLLHMVNDAGNTPLHELCACSGPISPECVELILKYAPETARWKNLVGDYPIHSASKNTACFEVLAMLLEQDSGAITLDRNYLGMTPLDNWCRSYGKDFEREIQLRSDLHCQQQQQHADDCNSSINDFWRVTSLFVLSLYSKQQQKQRVNLQEEHFASQAELTAFAAASMRGLHPLIYLTSFSQFLMCIREGVIDASSKREMYLLNKAILQGMEWSHVKIILDAYPDVLSELDERSNLYPFMLAATAKHDHNYDGLDDNDDDDDDEYGRHQLDTSFELLKAAPNLVVANMICQ